MSKDDQLYYFNNELHNLVDSIFEQNPSVKDLKGAFLSFALGKAYKTHASILILCKAGSGQDAAILTRSLFELAVTSLYILNDPTEDRVKRFMAFDWVMRKKMYDYVKSKPDLNETLQKKIADTQIDLIQEITQKADEAQNKYKYELNKGWSDKTIKDMAEEAGLGELYPTAYRLYCDLHHSAVRTINDYFSIDRDGAIEVDSGPSSKWVGQSLVGAFNFFGIIVEKWGKYLDLGLDGKLKELTDKYLKEVGGINKE